MITMDMTTAHIAHPCRKLSNGNILTCPVRLSFAQLLQPGKPPSGQTVGKYGATLLFPAGADISVLVAAAKEAYAGRFAGATFQPHPTVKGAILARAANGAKLHTPFIDQGDTPQFASYLPGALALKVYSTEQPQVIDPRRQPLTSPKDVYSGMWALVTIRPFAFEIPEKKGVSFGLQNVMKVQDGEKFGGKPNASVDFGEVNVADAFGALPAGDQLADMLG